MKADVPGTVLKRERARDAVLELIESRSPGDAIPSERALCALLGVSRPTLRAAVDELVAAGLLVREHGRGMFVAPEKITQELVSADLALTVPQAAGAWSSRLLEFTTLQAGARVGRKLRMSPADEIVYVARLRLVDGAPMAIEHLHIRAALVPGLSAQELEDGDLYEHLRHTHGVHVREAVQAIEPTVVTRAEAQLLEVPELSPGPALRASDLGHRGAGPWSTSTRSTGATATGSSPASPSARPPPPPRWSGTGTTRASRPGTSRTATRSRRPPGGTSRPGREGRGASRTARSRPPGPGPCALGSGRAVRAEGRGGTSGRHRALEGGIHHRALRSRRGTRPCGGGPRGHPGRRPGRRGRGPVRQHRRRGRGRGPHRGGLAAAQGPGRGRHPGLPPGQRDRGQGQGTP